MFPRWLNTIFPTDENAERKPEWLRHVADEGGVYPVAWSSTEIASLTTRLVCHDCNTGWMAELEERARPILTPLIKGNASSVTQAEQLVIATWATKTVMVLEPSLTPEHNFTREQRDIVRTQDRPPASVEVSMSGVEGPIAPMGFSCARVRLLIEDSPFSDYHFYTVYIGSLVLQIFRPDPPPADYGSLERMNIPHEVKASPDVAVVIFPPVPRASWPPRQVLDWDSLMTFTHRGIEMPEDWALPNPLTEL
jgi:hypothetical protein